MAFLFEPYNAYQKPPKKKHWMEIAEEEALLHRIQLEEQAREKQLFYEALKQHLALREAAAKQNQNATSVNNQNVALPQYFPQPAQQQVQDGQYAAPAGGGGWANPVEEEETEQAAFRVTPSSGPGKLTVSFTNLTPTPENDTFLWDFGSGSLTSTDITPADLIYVQTGSYTVTLQSTSSVGTMTIASQTVTVTDPTLFAWISAPLLRTGIGPYSASFLISNTGTAPTSTISGFFHFGDGTVLPYTASSMTVTHVYETGSWTASLALTESSYGHTSVARVYVSASVPKLNPLFTIAYSSSALPPFTVSFNNTSDPHVATGDVFVYRWVFGDGTTSTVFNPFHGYDTGSFPVRLTITESYYNIMENYTLPGGITASVPTLLVAFTTQSIGFGGAPDSYMEPVTNSYTASVTYNGNGTLTYFWDFGTGSLTSSVVGPIGNIYYTSADPFTASLQVTESSYNITGYSEQSFIVST